MKLIFIHLFFFLITSSILFSQEKSEVVFKDTLFFKVSKKDFVLFETTEKEDIYFRSEEEDCSNLNYFFGFQKAKKPNSNFSLIDLNEFLRKEEFFNAKAQQFKYDNIINRFYDNVIIFVYEKCMGNEYYLITPRMIIE